MAESVGLPFGAYIVVTDVVSPDAGLLAGTAVVWMLIAIRKIVSGSVSSLLMISALVLTVQTAVAISTGYMWMFQLQFPLANLAMCVVFARTAPTGKPLVAQLAEEVVALKQPDTHHPGLHRFFQGVTWFWAGLFLLLTLGMSFMMVTEPYKLFMLLSSAVTIGLTLVGAAICVVWFLAVVRRLGLRLRFSAVLSPLASGRLHAPGERPRPGLRRHASHSSAPHAPASEQLCIAGELCIAGDTYCVRYARNVGASAMQSPKCLNLKLKLKRGSSSDVGQERAE